MDYAFKLFVLIAYKEMKAITIEAKKTNWEF